MNVIKLYMLHICSLWYCSSYCRSLLFGVHLIGVFLMDLILAAFQLGAFVIPPQECLRPFNLACGLQTRISRNKRLAKYKGSTVFIAWHRWWICACTTYVFIIKKNVLKSYFNVKLCTGTYSCHACICRYTILDL